tara:strand:- start:19 stop:504 length:486 start_codon:yes stop_codon:yes gene_type:complete
VVGPRATIRAVVLRASIRDVRALGRGDHHRFPVARARLPWIHFIARIESCPHSPTDARPTTSVFLSRAGERARDASRVTRAPRGDEIDTRTTREMFMHRPPVKDRTQEFTAVVERVRKTASVTRETNGASASDASTTRGGARDDRAGDGNASDFAKVRSFI